MALFDFRRASSLLPLHQFNKFFIDFRSVDDTVVGSENVINGTFDTDLSGWTNLTNCQWDNGELNCANGQFIQQGIVSGEGTFRISWEQTINSGSRSRLRIRNETNSGDAGSFNYYTGSGYQEIILTVTNGITLWFFVESADDVNFDNISVQEYIPEP